MKNTIVTADWLKENLALKELVILDASPEGNVSGLVSDYKGIQIVGARPVSLKNDLSKKHAPFPNTLPTPEEFQKVAQRFGINNNSIAVVYDNLGVYTAPRVWWMFKSMGLEHCYVLNGGLQEWVKAKGETEPTQNYEGEHGDFVVNFNPYAWRDIHAVESNIKSKDEQVLDARSRGRFQGTAPEPRKGLSSGSIPNSKNLPYKEVLENGKLKDDNELSQLFHELSLENKPIVFTCGSGLTACITLLAASQVLDNPLSVYDSSWTEWAQLRPELVEKEKI
jgi:thiosulfate/3-mercaptopyruvate sulfurtransferase